MYFNNTVYFLNSNSKYILTILNSKSITYYYNFISSTLGNWGNRAFKIFIEQLPIPQIPKEKQKPFEILVDYIIFLKSEKKDLDPYISNENLVKLYFEEVLDAMVLELYFENEFKSKNIEFIKYVSHYFKPIEDLEDNKKIEIIKNSYELLTQRGNEIKDNLELMMIDLKELLEPILKV